VTTGPRKVLNLAVPTIEENAKANLTLIDPNKKWVLNELTNFSKSKNSPWFGKELTGKAVAVFNNGKVWLES
jgi:dihydroorotase